MKHTLQSLLLHRVQPYLVDGTLPPNTYRDTIQSLHSEAVDRAVASTPNNGVLGAPPPPVAVEELSLPRRYRTTLSQLRSGYCSALSSYLGRVGRAQTDLCPSCNSAPHTTEHLFSCHTRPTALTVWDLWDRPLTLAEFFQCLPLPFVLPAFKRP